MLKRTLQYTALLSLATCFFSTSVNAQFGSRLSGGNSGLGGIIGPALRSAPRGSGASQRSGSFPWGGPQILTPPRMGSMGFPTPPIGFGMRRSNNPGTIVGRDVIGTAVESVNRNFQPAQPLLAPAKPKQCPVPVSPSPGSTVIVGAPGTSAQVIHGPGSTTIVAQTPVTAADTVVAGPVADTAEQKLLRLIETAKTQFRAKKYDETIETLDNAVQLVPENSDVLQFRGFAHFAKHDYDAAAADVYDALLLGNTWNWQAVRDLYQSKEVYENHLRTLEAVRKAAPNMTHHFLLGYHYLVLEHLARGQKELERALQAQPGEPLVTQLVSVVSDIRSKE
ncbi:MAG: hypothetical protein AAFX06_00245 [Planctomycetota bacterium]